MKSPTGRLARSAIAAASSNRDFGYLPVEHSYHQIIWDAGKATKVEACGPLAT